jgi:hypothetical protein
VKTVHVSYHVSGRTRKPRAAAASGRVSFHPSLCSVIAALPKPCQQPYQAANNCQHCMDHNRTRAITTASRPLPSFVVGLGVVDPPKEPAPRGRSEASAVARRSLLHNSSRVSLAACDAFSLSTQGAVFALNNSPDPPWATPPL